MLLYAQVHLHLHIASHTNARSISCAIIAHFLFRTFIEYEKKKIRRRNKREKNNRKLFPSVVIGLSVFDCCHDKPTICMNVYFRRF